MDIEARVRIGSCRRSQCKGQCGGTEPGCLGRAARCGPAYDRLRLVEGARPAKPSALPALDPAIGLVRRDAGVRAWRVGRVPVPRWQMACPRTRRFELITGEPMPLPGGPADKVGNRYERLWSAYHVLCLLDGKLESVRLEEPGVDKAEFVVRRGDRREFHQAKRAGIRGAWSVASLAAEGVLQSMNELLSDPNASFVFVSACAASELADLCGAARSAESEQEFMATFLKAKTRGEPFERIRRAWQCDARAMIDRLRRIEVRTIGETELEQQVRLYARALFLADATGVLAELLRVVDESIHKTLRRDGLLGAMRGSGFVLRRVTGREQAVAAVRQATDAYLAAARRRLIHRTLVPRSASQTVLAGIGNSGTVLVGKAGSGKTACVVEIVEGLRARRTEVMAFRLDSHVAASHTGDLGVGLGLEESPVLMLATAAEESGGAGVLVVDQLDVVSTMSGRSSEALDLVEDLLGEAKALRERVDLHVVVVCRSFDWDNDHRLRSLIEDGDARVAVGSFTEEETRELLGRGGFAPALFRDAQLRLLRVPQNLSLFLDAGFATDRTPDFGTVTELFERYWDVKRRLVADRAGGSGDHWEEVLRLLCSEMTARQELSVRREVLDPIPLGYVEQMSSEGVLAFGSRRYGFGHESFFDYCYARVSFLPGSESLTSMLRASEQHLFRRGQVRQVLAYLRDADFDRYVREARGLLADPAVRAHIKDLVFAVLAEVSDPREEEWRIWGEWTGPALEAIKSRSPIGDALSGLAWRRLFGSRSWFGFLVSGGVVEQWLKSGSDGLVDMVAMDYLRAHQGHAPDAAARLLEPYVGSGGDWRGRLEAFGTWGDGSGSRRLFELYLQLIDDGTLDGARGPIAENSTFWDLFHGLDAKRPEWVGEVLAHRVRRRLAVLTEDGKLPRQERILGYDPGAAAMFAKVSASAPLAFVRHVLPVVLEVSDSTAGGDAPRRDLVWPYMIRAAHPDAEQACLEALAEAVGRLAVLGSDERRDEVLGELRRRDTLVANHLLLAAYRGAPGRLGSEAVAVFSAEPWRFECGYAENENWWAMKTIASVAPHLPRDRLGLLEDAVLRHVPGFEATVEGRARRGLAQFALLSAIPAELRSSKAQARFEELERKFGEPPGEPEELEAEFVGPPISDSDSEKMTDAQWLKAMRRYATEEWRGGRGEIVGGAHQLSHVLEDKVEKEPERFARLAMRFDADMHPAYMQRTLAGLSEAAVDDGLKLAVCHKAFAESREDCGREIADAIGSVAGVLPADAVEMIDWLATEHPDPEREQWQDDAPGGGRYWNAEVHAYGINTVRGRAARAIQRLILSDPDNLDRVRGTVDTMVKDPSSAVLSCVAGIFEAVAVTDAQEAVGMFLTMDVPTEELLATPRVFRFMKYAVATSFAELRPLIERMIRSGDRAVAERGAIHAGLALLHGHEAEGLVRTALGMGEAQRLGIAKVASSNIKSRECRAWCERRLVELFEDEAVAVRREAASCFRRLEGEPLEAYGDLVGKFSASTAFGDDPSPVLRALEESRQRLPGMTCLVCERHLAQSAEEDRHTRRARPGDPYTVVKLVFRTYQQHQKDDWATPALDMIDQLCLKGLSGTVEFDSFER